ncbi:Ankyrin repeat-containing protein [Cynara cardunculus var. scolymus]|uniref:Ankyrin repeat-containing protein n=1 Tax=Cynara cardunculus var. scolymus TaxID=59895 RepID=A0A103UY46_CYNCS|nr:Ankyrin repeat-containing protein [Cynara cardunculus var. scolymus]
MKHTGIQLASIDEQTPLSQKQQQEINLPVVSPQLNLPRQDLLAVLTLPRYYVKGPRENYIKVGIPLYEASIRGDWKAAKAILDEDKELVRSSITENHETALHVAASAKRTKRVEEFVENLVDMMKDEDLELQNSSYNTALCLAAAAGNVKMVKIMVKKNKNLLTIPGSQKMMPLYMAALFGDHDMVKYLYDNSKLYGDGWTPQNRGWLLLKCVESDLFDIALRILNDCPELASYGSVLGVLARKPDAFIETKSNIIWGKIRSIFAVVGLKVGVPEKESEALQLLRIIWKTIAKKPKNVIDDIIRGPADSSKQGEKPASQKEDQTLQLLKLISDNIVKMPVEIHNLFNGPAATTSKVTRTPLMGNTKQKHSSRILFVAAEMGNTKFVVELIRQYPDLIWKVNDNNQSIFHIAVKHRHEGIYNLLYEIGSMKDLITPLKDHNDNNMLHLVGKSAKTKRLQDVSGVALQMQRELLWFKEVEAMIPPSYRERRNKEDLTPHELFTKDHKDLVSEGEKWMKGTASQCMVVATLIATIVFSAAFTVPGGYNQDDGIPFFYRKITFMVFVVADAISLFSSSASVLMFLSILTSRYAERDFLESLPKKLMLGLTTLFLSITAMTVAFSVSFFVLYHNDLIWIPIVIGLLAAMPVLLFAWLQYPLLADVIHSTYGSRYLFRPKKLILYYENPKY